MLIKKASIFESKKIATQHNKSSSDQVRKNRKHLMSVSHLSVCSAASRENLYLLKQTVTNNNFDTFALSELWVDPTIRHADILIPGYTTFR